MMREPRVLLLMLVAVLAALAATQQSAAHEHKLLQVTSSLHTHELKARVLSWKSSSKADELHSFALLHLKALAKHQDHQQQQQEKEEDSRRRVCTALSQALGLWQQQHAHVLHAKQENQQREQQQEQKQQEPLQHEQIKELVELVELLEAAAAAECSALLQTQLEGDLKVTIAQSLHAPKMPASVEEAMTAALWAAAAAAGAAASVSPAANASLLSAAEVSFGLHAPTAQARGKLLLSFAEKLRQDSGDYSESAALLLNGARSLLQQPEGVLPEVYRHLNAALLMRGTPTRSRALALLLKTIFRVSSHVPSAFPSSLDHRRIVILALDVLTREINEALTHSQPLPRSLALRLEALLLAAEAGTFTAEIKAGEKTLKVCDLWGRELPETYEVSLQVKREKNEKQKVRFTRSPTSRCQYTPEAALLKSATSVEFLLEDEKKTKQIFSPKQTEDSLSSELWCPIRSIGISLETPKNIQTEKIVFLQPGMKHEVSIEAPAVIRLKIKTMPRAARGLAQASVLATLREAQGPLPSSVPRFTQWSLRVGMQDAFLLDLKIGDPEMLLPVSGLYDFEILLAQKNPLKTCRRLLFSASLEFPFPLKQIVVTVPDQEKFKQYAILPAEQALHPLPTIEHTFEPPPIKAPTWLALVFVLIGGVLPTLGLCYVWFWRLGANVKLLRWQVEDASFVGCLLLAVSFLAYFFVYRDFWFLFKMLAAASVPMVLLTHRAFVAVRIRRRQMGEEEEIDKAAFVRK